MRKCLVAIAASLLLFSCTFSGTESDTEVQNKQDYAVAEAAAYQQHCGVCHLASGQGVPGAFPPFGTRLATWSTSKAGQSYLVNVVANGLTGPLQVDDYQYQGVMPGMRTALSNKQIAELLNFVLTEFAGGGAVFSESVVEVALASNEKNTSLSLRPN